MGWEWVIAFVVAKVVVDAWDETVDAERDRWSAGSAFGPDSYTAAQIRAQRDRALKNLEAMRAQGPRNPAWWLYAMGWAARQAARAAAGDGSTGRSARDGWEDANRRWRDT